MYLKSFQAIPGKGHIVPYCSSFSKATYHYSNSPTPYEPLPMGSPKAKWKYHYFPLIDLRNINYQSILGAFMELVRSPTCWQQG